MWDICDTALSENPFVVSWDLSDTKLIMLVALIQYLKEEYPDFGKNEADNNTAADAASSDISHPTKFYKNEEVEFLFLFQGDLPIRDVNK